jgi:hypothetical protein
VLGVEGVADFNALHSRKQKSSGVCIYCRFFAELIAAINASRGTG